MLLDWLMYLTLLCKCLAFSAFSLDENSKLLILFCNLSLFFFSSSISSMLAFIFFPFCCAPSACYILPNRLCTSVKFCHADAAANSNFVNAANTLLIIRDSEGLMHLETKDSSCKFSSSVCRLTENPLSIAARLWETTSSMRITSHSLPYAFCPAIVENRNKSNQVSVSDGSKSWNADICFCTTSLEYSQYCVSKCLALVN